MKFPTVSDARRPAPSAGAIARVFSPNRFATRWVGLVLSVFVTIGPANATPEKATEYYEDAVARYTAGDFRGAVIQLRNALQQDDKMQSARLLLGQALTKDRDFQGAEAAFNDALKQGVDPNEVAVSLAQVYLALGRPEAVIEKIPAFSLPTDARVEVLSLRGTAYVELGNPRLASESFAEARALDPKSALPLIAEVPFLLAGGKLDAAKTASAKAVALAPTNPNAWNAKATVLHAALDLRGALAAYDQALSLDPRLVDARMAHAALLIDLGRDAEATKDLDFLEKTTPDEPRAAYLRAVIAGRKGDAAALQAAMRKVVKLVDALPPAWLARHEQVLMAGALAHHSLGNRDKAREYLTIIVSRNNRNMAAGKLLASIYLDARDFSSAGSILETLQKVAPDDPKVQYMLGSVRLAQKRYLAATELLERAASQNRSVEVTRALALGQMGSGREETGLANLEKAFATNPRDSFTGMALAQAYMRRGQTAKAVKTANAMVDSAPANLTLINFLGSVRGAAGDIPGARAAFNAVLAKDPGFRPASLNLARLDASENRYDDARLRLNAMLAKQPDNPEVLYEMGNLEQRAGRMDDAILYLQKAIEVQSRDPRPGLALIELYLGQRRNVEAAAAAKTLATSYYANVPVLLALARTQIATGNTVDARGTLARASRLVEYDIALQVEIGHLQLAAANPDGAFYSAYKALLGMPDDPGALALIVEIEARRGERAKADAALKTLVAKHPKRAESALATAELAMYRGQFPAAIAAYRTALSREESSGTAIKLARAHIAANDMGNAAAFLEGWVKAHPNDIPALKALAEVQFRAGRLDAARGTYVRALAAAPDDAAMRNNYVNLLIQLNDPEARKQAEETIRRSPGNPDHMDTLGWILVRQGDYEGGLTYLRDARARNPKKGEIRYHLAYALAKSGRTADAKKELAAAVSAPMPPTSLDGVAQLQKELGR